MLFFHFWAVSSSSQCWLSQLTHQSLHANFGRARRQQSVPRNLTETAGQAYHLDSINESVIWKMNTLVIAANSSKFNPTFLHAKWEMNIWLRLLSIRSDWKIFEWIKLLRINLHHLQEHWACRNFTLTTSRGKSLLITHARMQRWIRNLQLPTDSTFE